MDVAGFEHDLTADAVRHIKKLHPDVTDEEIRTYRELAASSDKIRPSKKDQGLPAIEYHKRIDGFLLIIQEQRNKKGQLALTPMKKLKAGTAHADSRRPSPYVQGGPGNSNTTSNRNAVKVFTPNTSLSPRVGNAGTAPELAERKQEKTHMNEKLIQALGLPPEATEEDILNAINKMEKRLYEFQTYESPIRILLLKETLNGLCSSGAIRTR